MITSRIYHSLHLDIAPQESDILCYILLKERLDDKQKNWLLELSEKTHSNLVVISGFDWGNDLTPWKAEGLKKGEFFGGKAEQMLAMLSSDFFVNIESSLKVTNVKRYICGVSLSGLFALWSSMRRKLFIGVAAISGSFWYDNFGEWVINSPDVYSEKFYFSLGEKEKDGKSVRMSLVQNVTQQISDNLIARGKEVAFEISEGGHFSAIAPRIEKALYFLLV